MTQNKPDNRCNLSRSGLIVSPFCLGTMTFGNDRWGSPDEESRRIFDSVEDGGNFVDYCRRIRRRAKSPGTLHRRIPIARQMVVATKFSFAAQEGNPTPNWQRAQECLSRWKVPLRRLGTDYVDLYWMHVWDKSSGGRSSNVEPGARGT